MTDVQTEPPPPHSFAAPDTPASARRSSPIAVVVWTLVGLAFLTVALVRATESALHFGGVPIDGPFQLYNALRRIAAGYRPGIDFQFFHGLGLPYLYYGFYRLFGGTFRASELARSLVSPIAYALVLAITLRAFAGGWARSLCLTAMALAVAFISPIATTSAAMLFAVNGMLGVRSMLATLAPVALFLARTRRQRILIGGATFGLALALSTEQGLAVVAAYIVVSTVAAIRRDWRRQVVESAATLIAAAATLVLLLFVIAGPRGAVGALRYNFSTVPGDQYWYFGGPPNIFLSSWGQAFRMAIATWEFAFGFPLALIAAVAYFVRLWRAPSGDAGRRNFALAVLPTYGLISCGSLLGVFTGVYTQPMWRTVLLVGLIEWSRLGDRILVRDERAQWLGVPRIMAIATLGFALLSAEASPLVRFALIGSLPHVVRDDMFGRERFAATPMWLDALAVGQRMIDTHRGPHGEPPTLWSTYSGWIEARNGLFNPSFDYMIHALGERNRQEYLRRFQTVRPTLVQTVRPTYTQYEPWLENTAWPFYAELLRWYDVADTTDWSLYWVRRAAPTPPPALIGALQLSPGTTALTLPPVPAPLASPVTVLEVELTYDTRDPLHWLPVIGRAPRYLVAMKNAVSTLPISLDPYSKVTRFPIVIRRDQQPTLHLLTASLLPGASFTVRSIRVFVVPVTSANSVWLAELYERFAR